MDVTVTLRGKSPLLMHNSQLADPDNEYAVAMAKINDKRSNKTPQDRVKLSEVEFTGGLLLDDHDRPVIPIVNLVRCFAQAAKVRRKGRDVERALTMKFGTNGCLMRDGTLAVPLIFDGPPDMRDRLTHGEPYVDKRIVKVGTSRIVRTRPKFPGWALAAEFYLEDTVLSFDDFKDIVEAAGDIEGLGDARRLGMGRFDAEVTK